MNAKPHSRPRSLEEESRGDLGQFRAVLKQELKGMTEQALREELSQHLGAGLYERTGERLGYRNRQYRCQLLTRYGEIADLAVPRAEEGGMGGQTQVSNKTLVRGKTHTK